MVRHPIKTLMTTIPKDAARALKKLTKRHENVLAPGETFTSMLDAVAIDEPQPSMFVSVALGGLAGHFLGRALFKPAARKRGDQLRHAFGDLAVSAFIPLPASKSGYSIVTTESRLLVFDGRRKELLTESSLATMELTPLDHGKGMTTVVFSESGNHVAVTSRREHGHLTDHFVHSFKTQAPASVPAQAPVPDQAHVPAPAQVVQPAPDDTHALAPETAPSFV